MTTMTERMLSGWGRTAPSSPAPGPKVHSESVRVLVAEDDENLGEVLARGLREHGYVVDLVLAGGGVRIETVRGVGYRITPA